MLVHLDDLVEDAVPTTRTVPDVEDERNHKSNCRSAADFENVSLQLGPSELLVKEYIQSRQGLGLEGRVERAGNQQSKRCDKEQTRADLRNNGMEAHVLARPPDATKKEAQPQT